MRVTTSFAALLVLTACGGGGGGGGVANTLPDGPPELIAYIQTQERLAEGVFNSFGSEDGSQGTAPSADFAGVMVLDEVPNVPSRAYYGSMTATATFAAPGSLTGSATGFVLYDDSGSSRVGTPVAGTLTLSSSALRYDDPTTQARDPFVIAVGGSLEIDGTSRTVFSSDIEAAFAGANTVDDNDFLADPDDDLAPFETAESIDYLLGLGTTTFTDAMGPSFNTLILGERQ
jgi:hypothetical protein